MDCIEFDAPVNLSGIASTFGAGVLEMLTRQSSGSSKELSRSSQQSSIRSQNKDSLNEPQLDESLGGASDPTPPISIQAGGASMITSYFGTVPSRRARVDNISPAGSYTGVVQSFSDNAQDQVQDMEAGLLKSKSPQWLSSMKPRTGNFRGGRAERSESAHVMNPHGSEIRTLFGSAKELDLADKLDFSGKDTASAARLNTPVEAVKRIEELEFLLVDGMCT
jgi:hypothetical protein